MQNITVQITPYRAGGMVAYKVSIHAASAKPVANANQPTMAGIAIVYENMAQVQALLAALPQHNLITTKAILLNQR